MTTERRLHEPTAARRPPSFGASESRCGRGVTTPGGLGPEVGTGMSAGLRNRDYTLETRIDTEASVCTMPWRHDTEET
jgi:hypothetical protein